MRMAWRYENPKSRYFHFAVDSSMGLVTISCSKFSTVVKTVKVTPYSGNASVDSFATAKLKLCIANTLRLSAVKRF